MRSSREDRVITRRGAIYSHYTDKQQAFLDFVLEQYVREGVGELDEAKLPHLIELRYHGVADAVADLGRVPEIRELFIGFQQHLYARQDVA
jgi:type I restriction enzyme, R subunit